MPTLTTRRVYFTMVHHPSGDLVRVGKAYTDRKTARSWVGFVRAAWHGFPVTVEPCTLRWVDGKLDAASVKLLDERYNLDAGEAA
jgi:hypothetical protein